MIDKKIIFLIAILVLLLGAGAFLYFGNRGSSPDLPVTYTNPQYGFTFSLPASWNGFSIVATQWQGFISGQYETSIVEQGPLIAIRNPLWTDKAPRQDIPILIFTLSQWNALRRGQFFLDASSALPIELGQNANYVFALPANYNGAHATGWEEVEEIVRNKPLHNF
jgi:hypothetical protein